MKEPVPTPSGSAPSWTMERLMELATGYWPASVLSAGVELGLFDALSDGPATCEALAERGSCALPHLNELCLALTAIGLLAREDDRYALAPDAEAWLNRKSPTCLLDALRFNIDLYPLWGRLADGVRTGRPVLPPGAHLGADPARTRRFALGMHSRALALAPGFLPSIDLEGAATLLDIASGPGTVSRLLAGRHPQLQVTQFDLPAIIEVARELSQTDPAGPRIRHQAGDYHTDPLPTGFDAALCCGAIHQEDEAFATELFQRVRQALNPGGRFVVVDFMLEPDRTGPVFSNLFSLNMMLTSPRGQVFTAEQLATCLKTAGFAGVDVIRPPRSPYWIMEAR